MNAEAHSLHHEAKENVLTIPFSEIHKGVYIVTLLAWAWLVGAFWIGFGSTLDSAFMVTVSTGYVLMFFGIPFLMMRIAKKVSSAHPELQTFNDFLSAHVDTSTGPITGREALIHIALVPVCLAIGTSGLAYAFLSARSAFGG